MSESIASRFTRNTAGSVWVGIDKDHDSPDLVQIVGNAILDSAMFDIGSLLDASLDHSAPVPLDTHLPFQKVIFEYATGPYKEPLYQVWNYEASLTQVTRIGVALEEYDDGQFRGVMVGDFEINRGTLAYAAGIEAFAVIERNSYDRLTEYTQKHKMKVIGGPPPDADTYGAWALIPVGQAGISSRIPEFGLDLTVDLLQLWLHPVKYALGMLACGNVTTERVLPTRQQRRYYERRGEPIPNEHRIIVKVPGKGTHTLAGPRRIGEAQIPAHMVRGHFAEYTPERPLFGKYSGQFWIPAHVRGVGEAKPREYVVKPRTEAMP